MATRGKHRMAKTNEDRCARPRRMHAHDLAPWVAEFTRHLSETGSSLSALRGSAAAERGPRQLNWQRWRTPLRQVITTLRRHEKREIIIAQRSIRRTLP